VTARPSGPRRPLSRARRIVAVIVSIILLLTLVAVLRFWPTLLFTVALASPALDARMSSWDVAPIVEEITVPGGGATTPADLYRPYRPRAAVLLVHGLSPLGRRHPGLVRLARLFARYGYLTMVPQFEGLATFHLGGREIDEMKAAIAELRRRGEPVAVAGFSFGVGPALIAAADQPDLTWVGSFGGYADLRDVIVFLTTGIHRFQGRRYSGHVEEYNRWKLTSLLAPLVDDAHDRERLLLIAARRLADPSQDVSALVDQLGPSGRTVMRLAESRREELTTTLLERLSPATRRGLEALSPLTAVPRLRCRLLFVHGAADDSIPFTESLRLGEAAGPRARVLILESFHHTGPQSAWRALHRRVTDGVGLLRVVDEMLRP